MIIHNALVEPAQSVLAMPASIRLVLLGIRSRVQPNRTFHSTSFRKSFATKYPNIAAFSIPDHPTTWPMQYTHEELFQSFSMPSASDKSLQDELTALFINHPPTFHYSESDFYKLKKNTRVPEVCILGRSNVGKSSFINALANRHRNVLARVSGKAGKTRSMNTYGFGPAPLAKHIAAQAAKYKGKEEIPTHAFLLVDMPGYGHASLKEWGRNINLYLTKRVGVKGAIVLIDAEVGPKDVDLHLLEVLSSAMMKTAIVLTKGDKVKRDSISLRETCGKIGDYIRSMDNVLQSKLAWEREIYITAVGAKDHAVASATLATARLAVARLAGFVNDNRPKQERTQGYSGKVISFDDLQYAPNKSGPAAPCATQSLSNARVDESETSMPIRHTKSPFDDLECASGNQHQGLCRIRPRALGSQDSRRTILPLARGFHNSSRASNRGTPRKTPDATPPELRGALDEFLKKLKVTYTTKSYAEDARRKHDRVLPLSEEERKNILERPRMRTARFLQKTYPKDTERTREVRELRLAMMERQEREKAEREARRSSGELEWLPDTVSSPRPRVRRKNIDEMWGEEGEEGEEGKEKEERNAERSDDFMTSDTFKDLITKPAVKDSDDKKNKKKKKKKGSRKKDKKGDKQDEGEMDEFEAKFSKSIR
ncbi:hypothetical protein GGR54DRAFT_586926 [Hypoxylon sp. NC1633]|nr:hypothetical protein GGR54DRAFT_586926 [Hypoxylon sp. NC1633]